MKKVGKIVKIIQMEFETSSLFLIPIDSFRPNCFDDIRDTKEEFRRSHVTLSSSHDVAHTFTCAVSMLILTTLKYSE